MIVLFSIINFINQIKLNIDDKILQTLRHLNLIIIIFTCKIGNYKLKETLNENAQTKLRLNKICSNKLKEFKVYFIAMKESH